MTGGGRDTLIDNCSPCLQVWFGVFDICRSVTWWTDSVRLFLLPVFSSLFFHDGISTDVPHGTYYLTRLYLLRCRRSFLAVPQVCCVIVLLLSSGCHWCSSWIVFLGMSENIIQEIQNAPEALKRNLPTFGNKVSFDVLSFVLFLDCAKRRVVRQSG